MIRLWYWAGADECFWKDLAKDGIPFDQLVVLSDIEGFEFKVFNEKSLAVLACAVLIIEIHDWGGRSPAYQKLVETAEKSHVVKELRTGPRDLSDSAELNGYCDNDRWLVCSEGRGDFGKWLYLVPRNSVHAQ